MQRQAGGDGDEIAALDEAGLESFFLHGAHHLVGAFKAFDRHRVDSPDKAESFDRLRFRTNRDDRLLRPVTGNQPRRAAGGRGNQKRLDVQVASQRDGADADRLRDCLLQSDKALARLQEQFGLFGHPHHDLDGLQRIVAGGGFLGEHECVGAVEYRVGDVRHLGARRARIPYHGAKHLCCRDHRLAQVIGGADHHFLHCRNALLGDFQSQIAPRHHNAVDVFQNAVQRVDGFMFFDFGDERDGGAPF